MRCRRPWLQVARRRREVARDAPAVVDRLVGIPGQHRGFAQAHVSIAIGDLDDDGVEMVDRTEREPVGRDQRNGQAVNVDAAEPHDIAHRIHRSGSSFSTGSDIS
jgi:hypothetical protein